MHRESAILHQGDTHLSAIQPKGIKAKSDMTLEEIKQLRAYTWYDGIYLTVFWVASFACFIGCMRSDAQHGQLFLSGCSFLAALTPFFVGHRLKKYRNEGLSGHLTYGRGLTYCLRVFTNATVLFALCQFLYMEFLDRGLFQRFMTMTLSDATTQEVLKQVGMPPSIMLEAVNATTPVSFATSHLVDNLIIGVVLSILIPLFLKKK